MWGVRVSGRDEVGTFGARWGLEMFSRLSQTAYQHFGSKPQNLGDLVVDIRYLYYRLFCQIFRILLVYSGVGIKLLG